MKTIPHIFYTIATLLVGTLLLPSCTKEDMSDCPGQVEVYFTFNTSGVGGERINPADIDRMHLYIFNDEGYYLREYRDDRITNFNTDYHIDCSDLLPGNYRLIAWSGKDERFYSTSPSGFVKNKTTFNEALLMLSHSGNNVPANLHHIFHAELQDIFIVFQKKQRFYMPLTQLSNTINVRTVGLSSNENVYTLNVRDDNCTYKFDKSFASHSHATTTYTAPCIKNGAGQLNASLNVLRLAADRQHPQLEIYNETSGKLLYPTGTQSGNLIGLILSAYPQNNFEITHTYDIVFTFTESSTGLTATVAINGWQVHGQEGELVE